ncbi:hypothetical protein SCHPADRAFT_874924 [Schizopora paradoxa]|uniref:Asl1-like glycosyl hydrolase catalytic domain-containing protein n=1 Tax=Schizopora paradoxa TaxID=27342 RepID=A0A0H2S7I2_9AGAM|nr:hypothetical protein SCHPADRAFT_874924 [Schizopora paradoxa]
MAFSKILNLFAISSLAVLVCSFNAAPVNALSVERDLGFMGKRAHGHDSVAKRKRTSSKRSTGRCKAKSTSSSAAASTPTSSPAGNSQKASPTSSQQKAKSTSAAPAASTQKTTSSFSSGGKKVGLAYTSPGNINAFITDNTALTYSWGPSRPSQVEGTSLTFMPMLWDCSSSKVSAFKSVVKAGYSSIAMGFNEVNQAGQANMSPQDAVNCWLENIEPLASQGYKLVSPSTTSAPDGITWMKSFLQICNGRCTLDYHSLHFYGTSEQDLISYISNWHNTFGVPIMLTEFACQDFTGGPQCSAGQVQSFYGTAIKWMESQSFVEAYFAYGALISENGVNELDALMTSGGNPTSLGEQYINVSW